MQARMDRRELSEKLLDSPLALDVIAALVVMDAPVTVTELANHLRAPRSSVDRAMKYLEGASLLTRSAGLYALATWVPVHFWTGCRALHAAVPATQRSAKR